MKINKMIIIAGMVLSCSFIFSDQLSENINNLRISYRDGKFIGLLNNASAVINSDCAELEKDLFIFMPVVSNFITFQTNGSFDFSLNSGESDYNISVEKDISNSDDTAVMTIATSSFDVERYDNLIKGFEYLGDKGDYEKYSVIFMKVRYDYLIDRTSAYFVIPITRDSNTGDISSGLLFKMTFVKYIKTAEKKKIVEDSIQDFILKFRNSGLIYIFR